MKVYSVAVIFLLLCVIACACVTVTVVCLTCSNCRIVDDSHLFLRLDMQLQVSLVSSQQKTASINTTKTSVTRVRCGEPKN